MSKSVPYNNETQSFQNHPRCPENPLAYPGGHFFHNGSWPQDDSLFSSRRFTSSITSDNFPKEIAATPISKEIVSISPNLSYLQSLKRTFLFKTEDSEEIFAFKIQLGEESIDVLEQEYKTLSVLNKSKENKELELKSILPTPIAVISLSELPEKIRKKIKSEMERASSDVNFNTTPHVYCYKTKDQAYFKYIQTIEEEDRFRTSFINAIHDWRELLEKKGVLYDQLIELVHIFSNDIRGDNGEFLACPGLVRSGSFPGSIKKWRDTVKHPNLRESGIADYGDFHVISELSGKHAKSYVSVVYAKCLIKCNYDVTAAKNALYNFTMFNEAGILAFVVQLVVTKRLMDKNQNKSAEELLENYSLWKNAALNIIDILSQGLKIKRSELEQSIDLALLTEQLRFWIGVVHFSKDLSDETLQKYSDIVNQNYCRVAKIDDEGKIKEQAEYFITGIKQTSSSNIGLDNSIYPITEIARLSNTISEEFVERFTIEAENKPQTKHIEDSTKQDWAREVARFLLESDENILLYPDGVSLMNSAGFDIFVSKQQIPSILQKLRAFSPKEEIIAKLSESIMNFLNRHIYINESDFKDITLVAPKNSHIYLNSPTPSVSYNFPEPDTDDRNSSEGSSFDENAAFQIFVSDVYVGSSEYTFTLENAIKKMESLNLDNLIFCYNFLNNRGYDNRNFNGNYGNARDKFFKDMERNQSIFQALKKALKEKIKVQLLAECSKNHEQISTIQYDTSRPVLAEHRSQYRLFRLGLTQSERWLRATFEPVYPETQAQPKVVSHYKKKS